MNLEFWKIIINFVSKDKELENTHKVFLKAISNYKYLLIIAAERS